MESEANLAATQSLQINIDSPLPEKIEVHESTAIGEPIDMTAWTFDQAEYTPQDVTDLTSQIFERTVRAQKAASVLESFVKASIATGEHVRLMPEVAFCPILIGNDTIPVYLYEVVETLEDLVDYDEITKELPSLSVGQISGAIAFLRRISQFNVKGVDIDALEDEQLVNNEPFLNELRQALADQETVRVLNYSK